MTDDVDIRKMAAWLPVTPEMVADAASLRPRIDQAFDRWANPWKYPDHNPLPEFVPFPILARLEAWLRRREHDDDE